MEPISPNNGFDEQKAMGLLKRCLITYFVPVGQYLDFIMLLGIQDATIIDELVFEIVMAAKMNRPLERKSMALVIQVPDEKLNEFAGGVFKYLIPDFQKLNDFHFRRLASSQDTIFTFDVEILAVSQAQASTILSIDALGVRNIRGVPTFVMDPKYTKGLFEKNKVQFLEWVTAPSNSKKPFKIKMWQMLAQGIARVEKEPYRMTLDAPEAIWGKLIEDLLGQYPQVILENIIAWNTFVRSQVSTGLHLLFLAIDPTQRVHKRTPSLQNVICMHLPLEYANALGLGIWRILPFQIKMALRWADNKMYQFDGIENRAQVTSLGQVSLTELLVDSAAFLIPEPESLEEGVTPPTTCYSNIEIEDKDIQPFLSEDKNHLVFVTTSESKEAPYFAFCSDVASFRDNRKAFYECVKPNIMNATSSVMQDVKYRKVAISSDPWFITKHNFREVLHCIKQGQRVFIVQRLPFRLPLTISLDAFEGRGHVGRVTCQAGSEKSVHAIFPAPKDFYPFANPSKPTQLRWRPMIDLETSSITKQDLFKGRFVDFGSSNFRPREVMLQERASQPRKPGPPLVDADGNLDVVNGQDDADFFVSSDDEDELSENGDIWERSSEDEEEEQEQKQEREVKEQDERPQEEEEEEGQQARPPSPAPVGQPEEQEEEHEAIARSPPPAPRYSRFGRGGRRR